MSTIVTVLSILAVLVAMVTGYMLGRYFETNYSERRSIGTLRIDTSDPYSPPMFFLELEIAPETLLYGRNGRYVTMKVNVEDYIKDEESQ